MMKKTILLACLVFAVSSHAQLGGLIKKAEKAVKKEAPSAKGNPGTALAGTSGTTSANTGDPFEGSKYWTSGSEYFIADEGIKTDLHKSNIEKIVFSKNPLNPATAAGSNTTSSFNAGDNIYALVFMKTALANYKIYNAESGAVKGNLGNNYKIKVHIDDVEQPYTLLQDNYDESKKGITSIAIAIHSFSAGDAKDNSEHFVRAFNKLAAGPHTIKISFWGGNSNMNGDSKDPIATGGFTLVKGPSPLKLGRTFAGIKAKKSDKPLEAKMVKVANTYDYLPKLGQVYSAAKIADTDWTIEKNSLGVILRRTITADLLAKETDGECKVYRIVFCEDYSGGGTYGATRIYSSAPFAAMVDCN